MFRFNKGPNQKILELGGGDRPHEDSDIRVDVRPGPYTNFTADFNTTLPIGTDEFDAVISIFAMEHLSWRNIPGFLSEVFRVTKPGGRALIVTSNTKAQIDWIKDIQYGWDFKNKFESCSCIIYGDNDYPENSHRAYFDPDIATELFTVAGFENIIVSAYGERSTDILINAKKPDKPLVEVLESAKPKSTYSTEEKFDKHYFNGGAKVGGYAGEGYRDFPVHEITFREVMKRHPASVLELGCSRGYILKRLQDKDIRANGLEVSRHCWLTRSCDGIINFDITKAPWPFKDQEFDLCFSQAALEHIPEDNLPVVISEMKRVCKRALHGIDFGANDDGFDKTHCTLKPKQWWETEFGKYSFLCEVVNKEELERGVFPEEVARGDGKLKLNIGSFTTQHHHGWQNIDQHQLQQFAEQNGYQFLQLDVRNGLPHGTASVDAMITNHFLEHLNYEEGLRFLRECRRVMKLEGCLRIVVPDTSSLVSSYAKRTGLPSLDYYNEINDGCERAFSDAQRLWALLAEGHKAFYDFEALSDMLRRAGFMPELSVFRDLLNKHPIAKQIVRETLDMQPEISLFVNAYPHD